MHANAVLRACMLGLVLVNLVFVQLTQVAGIEWLAPLYVATVASPLLARLRDNLAYRSLWNLVVVALFLGLLRHASSYDLRYVLQDGLVLAALCQVHLLNNLRSEQRPDLLFWNSFLIAVATGYLSQDLVFPFAFLVYVPLYVVGLQLLCVTRACPDVAPGPTRRIVRDGLGRSAVLLVLTLAVFLFWPRDFHRRSFLTGEFKLSSTRETLEVAFSDKLELRKAGKVTASNRVVMTVTLESGSRADVPSLWRGATLATTDGKSWSPLSKASLARDSTTGDELWVSSGATLQRASAGGKAGPVLQVVRVDPEANRIFTPLEGLLVQLRDGVASDQVIARLDATIEHGKPKLAGPPVEYQLTLLDRDLERGGTTPQRQWRGISRYVALPGTRRIDAARELARNLGALQPEGAEQHELVSAFSEYLETRYTYLPPGADGAAEDLTEFLSGESGGHCEFFASALATMLRSEGVACRVVTGYRSNEWDAASTVLTIRRRHAHAWVEVFDPLGGWYAVDPNPASAAELGPGLWKRVRTKLAGAWTVIASFDADRRSAVLAWARELPGELWLEARTRPARTAGIALLLVLLVLGTRRLGGARTPKAVGAYDRALRRAGLERVRGETPRELLDRAAGTGLTLERLDALRIATCAHEQTRYAA
ncbi:MAG: DUF3488 domain-containing transglutaminase family protein [bacterium]|nr:DUF3488 domain-containing transglutaminase family protein [bacterium]